MNGANVTRRLVVVSAVVAALVILAAVGFRFLAGGGIGPLEKTGEAEGSVRASTPATLTASPDPSFDNVLDDIELPSAEEEAALLSEVPRLTDPEERRRKDREIYAKYVMTPDEIAKTETIDLWRGMSGHLGLHIAMRLYGDTETGIRRVLNWSDTLREFTERPDAIDASIDEYKRFAAIFSQPDRGVHELLDMGMGPHPLAGAGFALHGFDRLLTSEAMIDRTVERADDFFRLYMERDSIIKAVMDERGEDSPWNNGTRWDLAQAAYLLAEKLKPERARSWLEKMGTDRARLLTSNIPGSPEPLWDFIEGEFLDK